MHNYTFGFGDCCNKSLLALIVTGQVQSLILAFFFYSFLYFFLCSAAIKEIMLLILNRKPSLMSNYRIITAGANVCLGWINELSGFGAAMTAAC